jgi:monoamine oxidase
MTQLRATEVYVAVIGAGAAGLAAGEHLVSAGKSVLVLEARGRVGGRAQTVLTPAGLPVDLGCGWLHSADRNPFVPIARRLGFSIDERLPGWSRGGWRDDYEAMDEAAAAWQGADRPLSAFLPSGVRWRGALDAISSYVHGAELEHVSAVDSARYEDSGINWRVHEGYGALIAAAASDVPVALGCRVRRVDHRGKTIELDTSLGTLRCGAAIVTVPTSILAEEGLRFDPPLPRKLEAASGLPLGVTNKVFLAIGSGAEGLPQDRHILGTPERAGTGSYQLRPHGRPLIECFFGGALARSLEAGGAAAMHAFACDELRPHLGDDVVRRLEPVASSAWAGDTWSRGAYSHARPGHAEDRARLAEPVDGRLFFAGEACSRNFFSTAHGARLTGLAAALECSA